ncbi:MAG: DUF2252 domain-containing protein [Gaiellaceae bacterium]
MGSTKADTAASAGDGAPRPPIEPAAHFTVAERAAKGKAARGEVSRGAHALWEPPPVRADPVGLLEEQAKTRVEELVPIRYGRMLVSPFTFYRGAAYIMAADLAGLPRTPLRAQLCGDAHLSNFGVYAAPDRRLVFDTNDFDETLRGPFEWDLKRLVASFAVAGRDRGFGEDRRRAINLAVSRSYREAMTRFATMRTLDVWYSRIGIEDVFARLSSEVSAKAVKRAERNEAKARTRDSLAAFRKLTCVVDGEPRIVSDPPLIVPIPELFTDEQAMEATRLVIREYRRTLQDDRRHLLEHFRLLDAARKVVGVGSVGTRAFILLFLGRDDEDPLFLQMKEAQASVLEPFLGKSSFASHGQRVVEGQRLMQAASDTMLGWIHVTGFDGVERDFYLRQLWDSKGSALIDAMEPRTMEAYATLCGQTIARAHARSGDAVAISSYLGKSDAFGRALADFAEAYADQNERDYAALKAAADSGRIAVEAGL